MSRYSSQSVKTTRPSQAIEDSKKKTSLLKDGSWIRKSDEEEEDIDRDPNFAKSVLSRYRSSETLVNTETDEKKPTRTASTSSVHALAKRFGGSQDNLTSSTLPSNNTTSSYTRRSYSSVKSPLQDSPKITSTSKTAVKEEPKTSSTTTTVTKDGKTTETTITTTQSVRSPVIKSPNKTETFTERVKSSSKGSVYPPFSPTRTSKVTETTVTSTKGAEDKLYDTLIPPPIKDDFSPKDSAEDKLYDTLIPKSVKGDVSNSAEDKLYDTLIPKSVKDDVSNSKTTVSSTKTVKSSPNGDGIKTTTTTRTSSTAEDDLYDTLLPKAITSNLLSPVSSKTKREIVTVDSSRGGESPTLISPSSTRRSYSSYTDDVPSYTISTKPSDDYSSERKTYSYSKPNTRSVLEKDLCTSCHKPFIGEAKMVLDDMKINCHASCFKCEVCNSTLGHMKAGDSMWIYKHMVHCERCFEITRDKWRR